MNAYLFPQSMGKVKPIPAIAFPALFRSGPAHKYVEAKPNGSGWELTLFDGFKSQPLGHCQSRAEAMRLIHHYTDRGIPGLFTA